MAETGSGTTAAAYAPSLEVIHGSTVLHAAIAAQPAYANASAEELRLREYALNGGRPPMAGDFPMATTPETEALLEDLRQQPLQ
jgi:hypothetical protein